MTLRRRLVGVLAAVVLIVTVGLAVASTAVLRSQLVAELDRALDQASERVTDGPAQRPGKVGGPPMPQPGQDDGTGTPTLPAGIGPGSAVVRYADGGLVWADHITT